MMVQRREVSIYQISCNNARSTFVMQFAMESAAPDRTWPLLSDWRLWPSPRCLKE